MSLHPIWSTNTPMTPEQRQLVCAEAVAQICHAANAEHTRLMGDTPKDWGDLDQKTRKSIIDAVLKIANCNGNTTPEAIHEDWRAFKVGEGWTQGKLNWEAKTNPLLKPWNELAQGQKLKSLLFYNIVNSYVVFVTQPFQEP